MFVWALDVRLYDFFSFDPEDKGIIQVIAEGCGGYCSEEGTFYYSVANRHRIQAAEPFEPDEMRVYSVYRGRYTDEIRDENNRAVENTREITDIISLSSQIEHNISDFRIIKTQDHTFVYIELNVNWHHPCILYYYNPESRVLAKICKWNGKMFRAIKVLNPELLSDLRPTYRLKSVK